MSRTWRRSTWFSTSERRAFRTSRDGPRSALRRFPRGVVRLDLVLEAAVRRLPAEAGDGLARVHVLVEREGVRETAHLLSRLVEREPADLAREGGRARGGCREAPHRSPRAVRHVE